MQIFQYKSIIENLPLSCLITVMAFFLYQSHALFGWQYTIKIFYASVGSEIPCIAGTTEDLIDMIEFVNLLLIWMKKQGSECACIVSLLKDFLGKYLKVYRYR